ncbi:MAG: peptidoglycan DD-metalloendopeptidase family protein [Clostridia bacterium]|nr:peptidoglycan DD-metalloendopeptidase family protein [Clostridia bacterium]
MAKKLICLLTAVIMIASVIFIPCAHADNEETQIKKLESELAVIKNNRKQTQTELNNLKNAKSNENVILAKQNKEIKIIQDDIATTQTLLDIYTQKIADNEAEIVRLEGELEKGIEIFKNRLVYNHENTGNISFLEFLFESDNFLDFISRLEISKELMDYDKKLLNDINENLRTQKLQKDEMQLASDNYTSHFLSLQDSEKELADKIHQSELTVAAFQKDIDEYERKLAQENAEMAAAEKEMRELMAIVAARNPTYNYSAHGFIWPLPQKYYISSEWGWRKDPFTGKQAYHNGLDIATSGTSPEIYAIAGGEVIKAGGNAYSGYGYYVIIDHGGGYQSLYGHMNKWPSVKEGETVKQGQVIGYVGTTGRSTGKHLHFTLYKDEKDVNPRKYIPVP